MKVEKRMVKPIPTEYEKEIYIANDGTEFDTKWKCQKYEEEIEAKARIESIRDLKIEFEGLPLNDDGCYSDTSTYRWYKVCNEEELDKVNEAFDDLAIVSQFPSFICVEMVDDYYTGDTYIISLEQIISMTQNFFKHFGMEVEIK